MRRHRDGHLVVIATMAGACALAAARPCDAEDDGGKPKPEVSVQGLAAGQYAHVEGDHNKLLEDEGNVFNHGAGLESFLLGVKSPAGIVFDMGLSFFVPDHPEWTEIVAFGRIRKPGVWALRAGLEHGVVFTDDTIGSFASTDGAYPSMGLGKTVVKHWGHASLGFSITPCSCSKIDVLAEFIGFGGQEVPLMGSRSSRPASGTIFEYPGLWDLGEHSGGLTLDAIWLVGAVGLELLASYRFATIDDKLRTFRPWDGIEFTGTDEYHSKRMLHSVSAALSADIGVGLPVTGKLGYQFAFSQARPASVADTFGDVWRAEYSSSTFSVITHKLPVGIVLTPATGLGLRLHVVGSYRSGDAYRRMQSLSGDPPLPFGQHQLESDLHALAVREGLSVTYTGLVWLDVKLEQRMDVERRDLVRALFDTDGDAFDTTRSESLALMTIRNVAHALLRFRLARGLVLEARVGLWHVMQDDTIEDLVAWQQHGDRRAWTVKGQMKLKYRLSGKLSAWVLGEVSKSTRWRPDVRDVDEQWRFDMLGWSVGGGIRAMPAHWLSLYGGYTYTHGDYEVASAPLLGAWDPIVYRGRVHCAMAGFGLSPLDWLGIDGFYSLVLVQGSLDQVVHGFSAEARFKVYEEVRIGAGYLGRVFADDLIPEDDYAGHVFRIFVSGTF
jgi:hypothetical protein